MSLLPFLVIAFGAGATALLARHRPEVSGALGIGGLAVAAIAGVAAPLLERLGVPPAEGGVVVFVTLGALCALLVVLTAAGVGTMPRSLPGASLLALGTAGLALLAPTPAAAVLLATTAGVISLVPVLDPGAVSERGAVAAAIAVRVVVLAGVAGLVATVVTAVGGDGAGARGMALVAVAAAVGVRLGVIPLHRPSARLAGLVPLPTLPLVAVWAPVALAWVAPDLLAGAIPPFERTLVVVLALVAIVLAALAALIHEDLPHVVGYGVALDGAVALLAIAAPETAAAPLRVWLFVVAVARTALAAWAVAAGGPAGVRRIGELRGWARRSPLLTAGLVGIGLALAGWPGSVAWEARADLLVAGVGGPVARFGGAASALVGLASAAAVVRIVVVGIGRRQPGAPDEAHDAEGWRLRLRVATAAALMLTGLALLVTGGWVG